MRVTTNGYRELGIHVLGYDLLRDDDNASVGSDVNAVKFGELLRLEYLEVRNITDRPIDWLRRCVGRARTGRPASSQSGMLNRSGRPDPRLPVDPAKSDQIPRGRDSQ